MAGIGVKALTATATSVTDDVEGGAAHVITKGGRRATVLLPVEEAGDQVLANADGYIRQRRQARAEHGKKRTPSTR